MKLQYVTVIVAMDAMTKITQTVPHHEVTILQSKFGEEAVMPVEGGDATVESDADAAIEYGRLIGKYGKESVVEIYRNRDELAAAIQKGLKAVTANKSGENGGVA